MNREERRRARPGTYQPRRVRRAGRAVEVAFGEAARPENVRKDGVYQAWIMDNYPGLAAAAWSLYEVTGRSALGLRFGDQDVPVGEPEPITPDALRISKTRETAGLLLDLIKTYDPMRDIVVGCIESKTRAPRETTWLYKLRHPACEPPRAAAIVAGLAAEARRAASSTVEAIPEGGAQVTFSAGDRAMTAEEWRDAARAVVDGGDAHTFVVATFGALIDLARELGDLMHRPSASHDDATAAMFSAMRYFHGLAVETGRPIGMEIATAPLPPGMAPSPGPWCWFVLPDGWTDEQFFRWIEPKRRWVERTIGNIVVVGPEDLAA